MALWNYLQARRLHGYKFRRQHSIGRFVTDFFCAEAMLAIEVDGDTHLDPSQAKRDHARQTWIESRGVRVVRFTDGQVVEEIDSVLQEIRRLLPQAPPLQGGEAEKTPKLRPEGSSPWKGEDR